MIIAIDGTAGSGKGTISQLIAKKYNLEYLDTGKLYRRIALEIKNQNINYKEEEELKKFLEKFKKNFNNLDFESKKLYTEEVALFTSKVAKISLIRKELNEIQRKIAKQNNNSILDGRDIGTVVLKEEANIKLYFKASPEERAKRRQKQLKEKNQEANYNKILEDIQKRDYNDMNRKEAPLKPAKDAIIIDTDKLTIEEVFKNCCKIIEEKR